MAARLLYSPWMYKERGAAHDVCTAAAPVYFQLNSSHTSLSTQPITAANGAKAMAYTVFRFHLTCTASHSGDVCTALSISFSPKFLICKCDISCHCLGAHVCVTLLSSCEAFQGRAPFTLMSDMSHSKHEQSCRKIRSGDTCEPSVGPCDVNAAFGCIFCVWLNKAPWAAPGHLTLSPHAPR